MRIPWDCYRSSTRVRSVRSPADSCYSRWPSCSRAQDEKRLRSSVAVLAAVIVFGGAAIAQAPDRIATTADALVANPLFFHGKRIVVRHPIRQKDRLVELDATAKPVYIFWREPPSGSEGEIRGEFWDLGRMQEGDDRFSSYDFRPVLEAANNGRWPARDQVFVILGATFVEGPPPSAATIRSIALAPEQ